MLLRNRKVINRVDMASGNSEVYRIDSQEDIVIDKVNSDQTCDSQRQDVEADNEISEVEVAIGREISKEVNSHQKEAVITPDMMQSFMQSIIKKIDDLDSSLKKIDEFDNSLKEIREENKGIKEGQNNMQSSLKKIDEFDNSLEKINENQNSFKESQDSVE